MRSGSPTGREESAPIEVEMPAGCGNAPRIFIVADFAGRWAAEDTAIADMLAPECAWSVNGEPRPAPAFPDLAGEAMRVELRSVITHGREAACEGTLVNMDDALDFCHVLRFSGAAKSARVVEVRAYASRRALHEEASA